MNTLLLPHRPAYLQRGVALLIALIFLVILTLLGLTAMQSSVLEEKMAGNLRDRAIAMDAAYAALRDFERDIRGKKPDATDCEWWENRCRPFGTRPISGVGGLAGLYGDETCLLGECSPIPDGTINAGGGPETLKSYYNSGGRHFWLNEDNWKDSNLTYWGGAGLVVGRAVQYRTFTGEGSWLTEIPNVAKQPRCISEMFNRFPGEITELLTFRITCRAWGRNNNTVVTVQEIFVGDQ